MKKHAIVAERQGSPKDAPGERIPLALATGQFVGAAASAVQLPAAGPREVAFAGRSNAGKSSAINALAGRNRLAFTSRTPGRTQQINFFALASGAVVADLPGYGYAAVPRALKEGWQSFLWQYVTLRDTLIGLVVVMDIRRGVLPLDLELLGGFVPSGRPVLVLATKCDKLNTTDKRKAVVAMRDSLQQEFPEQARNVSVVPFSATTREGVEQANRVLLDWLQT